MLFERIESSGLAHYSYLVGDAGEAVVIDPRRDCEIYIDKAARIGVRIVGVLETHRNEDYVSGSVELAARTGAAIWHADGHWDYRYGQPVEDGQTWEVGRLKLRAIHSPGHTLGSMSYLLYEPGGAPWAVFTGDCLFAGDVGRVDLMGPERLLEMAGLLYDTLFERIIPLGDEILVCPAHGAGSVCGSSISERMWTTVGLERRLNPRLQHTRRDEFIAHVARQQEVPPYFRRMEKLNVEGAPILGALPVPMPLAAGEFAERLKDSVVLDTRSELSFGAAHIPGSLSIWIKRVPGYAGWFLPYDRPLLLVNEADDPVEAVRYLIRLGYDDLAGYLAGGLLSWHTAGERSESVRLLTVHELCRLLDDDMRPWILDVRKQEELENEGEIPNAHHVPLTHLPQSLDGVPKDRPVFIFCGSGLRSMIAASILKKEGWSDVAVIMGGFSGWSSTSCPIEL